MPNFLKRYTVVLILSIAATGLWSQRDFAIGPSLQVYPTGIIPGLETYQRISDHGGLSFRLGYNIVRHGDAGVHSDERGGGPGGSIGYQYRFGEQKSSWFAEIRSDLWFNSVNWEDRSGDMVIARGTSEVTVVQPTLSLGYQVPAGDAASVDFLASFGVEINARTKGAAVGQGAIALVGVRCLFGKEQD